MAVAAKYRRLQVWATLILIVLPAVAVIAFGLFVIKLLPFAEERVSW